MHQLKPIQREAAFTTPGPGNPSNMNWKNVAIYATITIAGVVVISYMVKSSFDDINLRIEAGLKEVHADRASHVRKDETISNLSKTVRNQSLSNISKAAATEQPAVTDQIQTS